jgi:hypothetical protein
MWTASFSHPIKLHNMNIDLKKIDWFPGKPALQPQLMTLRVRKKHDPDEESSYITIADDLLVYTDGSILNPPVINNLDEGTTYVFRIINNNIAGGQLDTEFTTPLTYQTDPLTKSYYPGSELAFTANNIRSAMLPYKPFDYGAYFSLAYTRADWFGIYDDAIVFGDSEWQKKDDLPGLKLKDAGSVVLIRMDDQFPSQLNNNIYAFGVNFYVAAEDLPATGIWNLISVASIPNGDGVQVYVNCDTRKVHWRQQKGAVIEEIISAGTINTGAWNRVLVYQSPFWNTTQLWLNSYDPVNGTFTAASKPVIQLLQDGGIHVGATGGIFSNIYCTTILDTTISPARYIDPPLPVGILENYYNPEEKYTIQRKNMIVIEENKIVCTIPPDVPPGPKWFYIQIGAAKFPPVQIEILPMKKVQSPEELDFSPDGGGGNGLKYRFSPLEKGWGGANGGVSWKHIYMQDDGLLVLEAHGDFYDGRSQGTSEDGKPKYHDMPDDPLTPLPWTTRVGAAIVSKDYYGYGRYVVEAQLPAGMGVAPSFWVSHYSKIHPQDPRFEEVVARGLHVQGDQYNGDYYVVEKNEIDLELPSHNANRYFNGVEDMLSSSYPIAWTGQTVAVVQDPDPANIGTWQLNNTAAPDQLASWTKINNEVQLPHQPRKSNMRCSNWKGEIGSGDGSWAEDEFLTMLTSIGKDVWDGAFHEFRFDWYADRVEFYVDGQMIQVNRHYVPDVPGRWKIGLWFPSPQHDDQPWRVEPYGAWAGPANWKYQKMLIKRIAHTPFTDAEAGGPNRLIGETNPFDGLQRMYRTPNPD